jgi:hypothetical protein
MVATWRRLVDITKEVADATISLSPCTERILSYSFARLLITLTNWPLAS